MIQSSVVLRITFRVGTPQDLHKPLVTRTGVTVTFGGPDPSSGPGWFSTSLVQRLIEDLQVKRFWPRGDKNRKLVSTSNDSTGLPEESVEESRVGRLNPKTEKGLTTTGVGSGSAVGKDGVGTVPPGPGTDRSPRPRFLSGIRLREGG